MVRWSLIICGIDSTFSRMNEAIVDAGGAPKTWNVGILPVKGHFEVTDGLG